MLTKEEIRNLRIGDEIYLDGILNTISELYKHHLAIEDGRVFNNLTHEEEGLSLNPPKKMVKMWKWAVKTSEGVVETSYFLPESNIPDCYIKLLYTEIEVEE